LKYLAAVFTFASVQPRLKEGGGRDGLSIKHAQPRKDIVAKVCSFCTTQKAGAVNENRREREEEIKKIFEKIKSLFPSN